jgi:transcriptional regulator with XRE-family HTH domain
MSAGTYDDDTLGGRMSLCRESAGLTVAEAASRLGVLVESWEAWERDRDVPRSNRLTMMAGLLGVSPSWLLSGQGAGPVERVDSPPEDFLQAVKDASQEVAALNKRIDDLAASLQRRDDQ